MKTLKKFECPNAKIIVKMHDVIKENTPAFYSIQETPNNKKAKWKETTKYFNLIDEANKYFLELVSFWCI